MKMNKKNFGLIFAGILFLALFANFISAITISNVNPFLLEIDGTSFSFDITFDQNGEYYYEIINTTEGTEIIDFITGDEGYHFNITDVNSSNPSTFITEHFIATYNASDFDFKFGKTYSTTIKVYNYSNDVVVATSQTIFFKPVSYCESTQDDGSLDVIIDDVNTLNGFGDDGDYWYPFDEIEIKVNVENTADWDIRDIEIAWALYTTGGKKIDDDTLSDFKLETGDDKTVTFTINLDKNIDDFENEDAVLYVRAKGKIDNNNEVNDNEYTCGAADLGEYEIRDDDFVILRNLKINGMDLNEFSLDETNLTCNEQVTINGQAWNIGSNDQQEVYLHIYNKDLNISQTVDIGDIDAYDNQDFTFTFTIPKNAAEKWHSLRVEIYDDNNDIFENSEEDKASFDVLFKVAGCAVLDQPLIVAELVSEQAIAGKEFSVKFIITNPSNSKTVNYDLNLEDYSNWASLVEFNEDTLTLAPEESKEVIVTFKANRDTEGEQLFNLEVFSEGELVASQPVAVEIEKGTWNIADFFNNNWKILGIALLNLILVIVIIIVAVRTYRK